MTRDAELRLGKVGLGRLLQAEHPEILTLYRDKMSQPEMARKLGITTAYNVSAELAVRAIGKALRGHSSRRGAESYKGLASRRELDRIAAKVREMAGLRTAISALESRTGMFARTSAQNSEAGKKGGNASKLLRTGIHASTKEQMRAAGTKGGLIGGAKVTALKLGVHALTAEQSRANGMKSISSNGRKPWSHEEDAFVIGLLQNTEYLHGPSEAHMGKPNWDLVSLELNVRFHDCKRVRSPHATLVRHLKRKAVSERLYI